jgi:hypothetical protein
VVLGVPFIVQETEQRGQEAGGQAPADGAPLTYRLLEEETMRWPFDEGEIKRRRQCVGSLARRVALVLEAAAVAGIGFELKRGPAGPSWAK